MKKLSVGKLVGVAALVAGSLWAGFLTYKPMLRVLTGKIGVLDFFPTVGLGWLLMFPTYFSLYFGTRLVMTTTREHIKGAVGSLSAGFVLVVVLWFPTRLAGDPYDPLVFWALLLAATVVAILLHVITCRAVMRREGIPTAGYREFLSKPAIFLVAVQIFMIGSRLVERFAPKNVEHPRIPEELWSSVGFLGSLLLAWGFYRFTEWYVERGRRNKPDLEQF